MGFINQLSYLGAPHCKNDIFGRESGFNMPVDGVFTEFTVSGQTQRLKRCGMNLSRIITGHCMTIFRDL